MARKVGNGEMLLFKIIDWKNMITKFIKRSKVKKVIAAFIASISCLYIAHAHAENKDDRDAEDVIELRKVDLFAMGYIGFVGHISSGQKLYEEILKSKNAESIFLEIIDASDSSVASKLYSLCGLKKLLSTKYKNAKKKVSKIEGEVSMMTADIMRKEDITDLVKRFDHFRC